MPARPKTTLEPYVNWAELDHFYDGDTAWLWVDLGYRTWKKQKFRLLGVDTPELRGSSDEEKEYARQARYFAMDVVNSQDRDSRGRVRFLVQSTKKTKYDFGITIFLTRDENLNLFPEQTSLADYLILRGHGVPYQGKKKQSWKVRKAIQDAARAAWCGC